MNINIGLALIAAVFAAILMWKYRRFFQWEKSDDWGTFYRRAREETQKDAQARLTMFGTLGATNRANLINFSILLCLLFLSTHTPYLLIVGTAYMAIGLLATRRFANSAKTPEHGRLLFADRLWFRLYFSWAWPFYLIA